MNSVNEFCTVQKKKGSLTTDSVQESEPVLKKGRCQVEMMCRGLDDHGTLRCFEYSFKEWKKHREEESTQRFRDGS